MNEYIDKEKSLKELNEEKTIIALELWWFSDSWRIKYLNKESEPSKLKDLNLSDFKENIKYLVNLRELRISNNELQHLDLSNCVNLNKLYLNNNKFIKVTIPTENKIEYLSISNNVELKEVNLEVLNPEYLNDLSLFLNDKLELKTAIFSKFVNLKELYINNSNLSGSLIHLRNLIKLECLWISYTNITPSFEYLPNNVLISSSYINYKDPKRINKFLTMKNNLLLGNDLDSETLINISKFKDKHSLLSKNGRIVISLYEELVQINKDKKYLDRCLTFIENKNNGIIQFKRENEVASSPYLYSNSVRFNIFYQIFCSWLYDKNKELNDMNSFSLDYYSDLIEEKIEYSTLF
ncbi:MAG: hypothetical protein AM1032_000365 [Mycoplasmataceae bacterium]|nr:MAG: hypothetical protein AM1032_000365 [Mycoplasmataceae bacterium]